MTKRHCNVQKFPGALSIDPRDLCFVFDFCILILLCNFNFQSRGFLVLVGSASCLSGAIAVAATWHILVVLLFLKIFEVF